MVYRVIKRYIEDEILYFVEYAQSELTTFEPVLLKDKNASWIKKLRNTDWIYASFKDIDEAIEFADILQKKADELDKKKDRIVYATWINASKRKTI